MLLLLSTIMSAGSKLKLQRLAMQTSGVGCLEAGDMTDAAKKHFVNCFPDQHRGLTGIGCKHVFEMARLGYHGPWEHSTMYLCLFAASRLPGISAERFPFVNAVLFEASSMFERCGANRGCAHDTGL